MGGSKLAAMRLKDTILFRVSLGNSREQVLAALGEPQRETWIADDNKTNLLYSPKPTAKTGLFGPPPGGAIVRIDSNGFVDHIRARGSMRLGFIEVNVQDSEETVLERLSDLRPFTKSPGYVSYCDDFMPLLKSDRPVTLAINFRDGIVQQFELEFGPKFPD